MNLVVKLLSARVNQEPSSMVTWNELHSGELNTRELSKGIANSTKTSALDELACPINTNDEGE